MKSLNIPKSLGLCRPLWVIFFIVVVSVSIMSCDSDGGDKQVATSDEVKELEPVQTEPVKPDEVNTNEIQWITSWDKGFEVAKKEGKKAYVLFTAPSWCHFCQIFEKDTLTDKEVIERLNSEVVPIMILDTNKEDMRKVPFQFGGFPTSAFMTENKELLFTLGGAIGKDTLLFGVDRVDQERFNSSFDDKLKNMSTDEDKSIDYLGLLLDNQIHDKALTFSDEFIKVFPNSEKIEDVKYVNIMLYHNKGDYETASELRKGFIISYPKSNYTARLGQLVIPDSE